MVADANVVHALRRTWTQVVGLEMEGAGSAAAAHEHATRPSFILTKGVCDHATSEKNDQWQEYAADAAGRYAISLLIERGGSTEFRQPAAPIQVSRTDELASLGLARSDLFVALTTSLDLRGMRRLYFDLELEWEDVPDRDTKSGAAISIIEDYSRRRDLKRLLGYLREKRPDLFE